MKPLLSMKGITKKYSGITVLNNVDVELESGQVLALVGENGAGKSTLIKILCGSIQSDGGSISIDGQEVNITGPLAAQNQGIFSVQQHFSLIPTMDVAENLYFNNLPMKKAGMVDKKKLHEDAKALLESLEFNNIDTHQLVSELSVGNAQRVEVAKAVKATPRILILDEPSAVLPENDVITLFKLIGRLKASGVGIIYISHHMDEVFEIADKITVLKDGEKVTDLDDPSQVDQYKLVQLMVGRTLSQIYPPVNQQLGETVLKVENLCTNSVKNISFSLRQGEVLGFAGLVGAGRSELCRALFGLDRVLSGDIELYGEKYTPRHPKDAIKAGLGFVTEDRHFDGLILGDTVERNISFVGLKKLTARGTISEKRLRAVADDYIKSLNIVTESGEKEVGKLSGGNQQKVVLAKWLFIEPRIILFDEGTRGIDVNAKHEIYELISRLTAAGNSVIMVSSELTEVMQMSNRILVMREGEIVSEFTQEEATEEEIIQKASGL